MLIGQLSELSGYSQRMIRYLEDLGLLAPDRSESNLREFNESDLARVLKIKRFKELGFTYLEIKSLIDSDNAVLVNNGTELLKRHHAEAHELIEKIQRLESICLGEIKTKSIPNSENNSTGTQKPDHKIQILKSLKENLSAQFPELDSQLTLWRFREFLNMQESDRRQEIEVAEIFRGSSQIAVLSGQSFFQTYESAWAKNSLPLRSKIIGQFPFREITEFFGHYEIVIEHSIVAKDGSTIFRALIPYQAVLIASGDSVL